MKEVISYVTRYEAHFRVEMEQKLRLQSEETIRVYKKLLAQAEKRIGELDRLFIKIYEDNAKGKLNDDRFAMMSKTYEDEQAQLKVEIINLQKEVEVQERQIEDLEQFIQRARRYTDPHGTYAIRSQRACKGGLCRSTGQVQRQAQAEGTYRI